MKSDWSAKTSSAVKCSSRGNKRSVWHCSVHWKKSVERRFFCKKFSYDGGLEIKGPHPPRKWNFARKCFWDAHIKPRNPELMKPFYSNFPGRPKSSFWNPPTLFFFFSQRNIPSILCFLGRDFMIPTMLFWFPSWILWSPQKSTHGEARCRRLSCGNPARSSKQNCGKLNWSNVKHWQR